MANYRKPFPMPADAAPSMIPWQSAPSLFTTDAPFHLPQMPWAQGYGPADLVCYGLPLPFVPHREPKLDPKLGSLSAMGWKFIYVHETLPNVSNHLHWPRGASGITLGPGYDMKARSADQITADMKAIGLSDDQAKIVAQAAGMVVGQKINGNTLTSKDMNQFAHDHHKDVSLSDAQQMALLKRIGGHYQAMVHRSLKVPLAQHEFDALVSFAYNPGAQWLHVAHYINHGKVNDAMKAIRSANRSGGQVLPALTRRRSDEVTLFLQGKYEKDGHPISL